MQKNKKLSSTRLKKIKEKRRRASQKRFYLVLTSIIVFFVALIFISRINGINVVRVEVSGNKIIDVPDIQKIAEEEINGNYFLFIPKSNYFLVPKNKIKNSLFQEYPRLNEINIKVSENQTLALEVKERDTQFTWCGEDLPREGIRPEEVKCYFTDAEGFVFDESPYFSSDVYFRFYGDLEGESLSTYPKGRYISKDMDKLVLLKEAVDDLDLTTSSYYKNPEGYFELYLASAIRPPSAPKVIFELDKDSDVEFMVENLRSAIYAEPLEQELDTKYEDLEYLDLRFGNRVYYKFR